MATANKEHEQKHVSNLVKSLPTDASSRTKQALKIALLRLDLAWKKDWPTDHLIAEIEYLIKSALPKKPLTPTPTVPPCIKEKPPEPPPAEPKRKLLVVPESIPDQHFVRISTVEEISFSGPTKFDFSRPSVPGEIYDGYLLDPEERFERTPLLINENLIDAGDRAATIETLHFVGAFAEHYQAFVKNVFLMRFQHLTKMEATTRKTVNDFRQMRAKIVSRWVAGLTFFLRGIEDPLIDNNELLVVARNHVNQLPLNHLFNVKTGHITFRATKWTNEQSAAECKLLQILVTKTRGGSTTADLDLLQALRNKLKPPTSVCEDIDTHLAKMERLAARHSVPIRVPKDRLKQDLAMSLATDPIYCLAKSHGAKLQKEIENDPFLLFQWLSELGKKIKSSNADQATDTLMTTGLNLTAAQALTQILALRPDDVERRLQSAFGEKSGGGQKMLRDVNSALSGIHEPRLRFAFVSFMEQTIRHFADTPERSHHINDRLHSTAAYFLACDDLLARYARHLPLQISDARLYVLQSTAAEKIATKRKNAGTKRFDQSSASAGDIGRCLLALLTAEEKQTINAVAWFREMFSVDEKTWRAILRAYAPPHMDAAPSKTQEAFIKYRDLVITANIWKIMVNKRGYPFANAAIKSLKQRARAGQVEILHGLSAAGIKIADFCANIRSDVYDIFFHIPDTMLLPTAVTEAQISNVVTKIIRQRVAPRHWRQWVIRRAKILVKADELIKKTNRRANRKKILLSLLSAHSHRIKSLIEKFPVDQ